MKIDNLVQLIEAIAPPHLAEPWDNSGLQIQSENTEIKKVLVCLDVTKDVVEEAVAIKVEMIISHHPLFFQPVNALLSDPLGQKVQTLIKEGISVYSAHMTYDKSPWGNTAGMAKRLGFDETSVVQQDEGGYPDYSVLVARLNPPLTQKALLGLVSSRLSLQTGEVRLVSGKYEKIDKIGICAGSGGEFFKEIVKQNCQAYVTGDVKYHLALEAKEAGISLIDPGHFGTEKYFAQDFAVKLVELAGREIEIHISDSAENPFLEKNTKQEGYR